MLFKKTEHHKTGREFFQPANKTDAANRSTVIYDMQVWVVYGYRDISTALACADGSFRYKRWFGNSSTVLLNHILNLLRDDTLKKRFRKEISAIDDPDIQLDYLKNVCAEFDLSGAILIADFGNNQKNTTSFLASAFASHIESWSPYAKDKRINYAFDEHGDINGNAICTSDMDTEDELDWVNGN